MRILRRLGLNSRKQSQLTRVLQALLVAIAGIGIVEGVFSITINALISLAVTFAPSYLERDLDIVLDPALALWITLAVFLHSFGALGPYRNIWWWDHMTHALSSSIVAASGYIAVRALDQHSEEIHFPSKLMPVFLVAFVMAFGVVWEVIEFMTGLLGQVTGTKILTQYGLEDTMKDLLFDSAGALLVAFFGEAYLSGLVDQAVERLEKKVPDIEELLPDQ
ncbi:hypothetical protein GKQ38_02690 [Candidatus Nanohaloarchaea archaeon]|nr:hypothetical protein GKQ38_02690 [Candidatus Nanohaloarchaea archaeon]